MVPGLKSLTLVLALTSITPINAQNPFEKVYPSSVDQTIRDFVKLPDGGYMMCGMTNNSDPYDCDVLVARTDNNGNMLSGWPKIYHNKRVDYAYSMVQTAEGDFLIAGYSASFGGGDIDIYLLKININGDNLMEKTFGSVGFDEGREIIKTSDGNYVIAGTTTDAGNQQACLIKINSSGTQLFFGKFGGATTKEFGNAVQECTDGSFIVAGQTLKDDPLGDSYLVKVDNSGGFIWDKSFARPFADEIVGIVVESDNSIVAAIRDSTGNRDIDVLLKKFDNTGAENTSWGKPAFGGSSKDTPKAIIKAKDGNYYVSAISRSWNWRGNSDFDSPDMWLLKIDAATGDTLWSRNFGFYSHDHLHRTRPDPTENAILLGGHSRQGGIALNQYFLKISENGKLEPMGLKESEFTFSNVYPNPTDGELFISTDKPVKEADLIVTTSLGQVVFNEHIPALLPAETKIVKIDKAKPGMYLLTIKTESGRATRKIIVR
jgi:hypothetical protein